MGRIDAKTSLKGQVTIPIEARRAFGLPPGGAVQFVVGGNGNVSIVAKKSGLAHLKGLFGPARETLDIDEAIMETVRLRNATDRTEDDP